MLGSDALGSAPADGRFRVFISSTLGELAPEREAAKSAVRSLRLLPILFELGSDPGSTGEGLPSSIDQADVFVGIYWQSYGWVTPGSVGSNIEDELDHSEGIPRLVYVKEPAPERDRRLVELLSRLVGFSNTTVRTFESPGELAELMVGDLAAILSPTPGAGPRSAPLPEGTLTFMFCDIEGSTHLLEVVGSSYQNLLEDYRAIIELVCTTNSGRIADMDRDRAFLVFQDAAEAVDAAVAIQLRFAAHTWPGDVDLHCRIGLHTGTAALGSLGYVGLDVHRAARIASSAHGGQIVVSAAIKGLTEVAADRAWSLRELGSFALKGLSRSERLFQVLASGLVADFPPPRARSTARVRLPATYGSLVGRHRETQEVAALLAQPNVRQVTLTGPGGVGKTRVALATAQEVAELFPDGVYFVNLASVSDPAQVLAAIGAAAGVPIEGDPLDAVAEAFQHQQVMLVLDNFEQVVEAAPLVGNLLGRSPGLKILVTSRVVMRIAGEHEYSVDSLSIPPQSSVGPEEVAQAAAVELFVERAGAVAPGFRLTEDNASTVAMISRMVDGLPLAIELAAARLRTMTADALARRLGESLEALGQGAADLPDRQRTLEAAIDWSYQLLTEPERRLFARLGVFTGGFTIDSAQEVAADNEDVIDLLTALVDNSMVLTVQGASGRMRMLAPIREFSLSRLDDSGDTETVKDRHAAYFVDQAETASPLLKDTRQAATVDSLLAEWPNIEAAATWLISRHQWDQLVRLTQGLWVFVWVSNHLTDARTWMLSVPDPPPGLSPVNEGRFWWLLGGTGYEIGEYEEAMRAVDRAIPLLEAQGDDEVLAWASFIAALLMPAFDSSLDDVAVEMDAALGRFRDVGDRWGEGYALIANGLLANSAGDFASAEDYHRQCRELGVALDNDVLVGQAETQLGYTYLAAGRNAEARDALRRAVEVFRPLNYREGLSYALEALAALSFGEDRPDLGMIALGAAEGIRSRIGLRPWPAVRWFFEMLSGAADGLSDPQLQAARRAGREMSPFDAVDLVLGAVEDADLSAAR